VERNSKDLYRAQQFARLAGVTVRALHHYDRLGLLKPKQRSSAGYRLYSQQDFGRLEQIVVLKFLGMPLKQIRTVLESEAQLGIALRRQQSILAEKRRQLDQAIAAISNAQQSLDSAHEPDWRLFQFIIQEIEMQNSMDWSKKYYSPEAQAKVAERQKLWSPELQEQVSKDWAQLIAEVELALGEDPSGAKAQALAARWRKLVEGFTGGDPEIQKGLNKMWADQASWPVATRQAYAIKPEVQAFIIKAMQAEK
jgi:DNA-binding transcriptional MerR regulator